MEFIPLQYDRKIIYQWNLFRCNMDKRCCINEFIPLQYEQTML